MTAEPPAILCQCTRRMRLMRSRDSDGLYRCGCGVAVKVLNLRELSNCAGSWQGKPCTEQPDPRWNGLCYRCAGVLTRNMIAEAPDDSRRFWTDQIMEAEARRLFREEREQQEQRRADYWKGVDARRPPAVEVVYYVCTKPGVIKIGTTGRLVERMKQLRVYPDDVLAAEPGSFGLEKLRHRQWAAIRMGTQREDFADTPELRSFMAALVAQHGEPYQVGASPLASGE